MGVSKPQSTTLKGSILTITPLMLFFDEGSLWSWSNGSWIYNYLCNQCLSLLMLWVWIPLGWGVLNTTLCNKVCQWLADGWWFSQSTPASSTNKTDCHNITEILLKVALNSINPILIFYESYQSFFISLNKILIANQMTVRKQ